MIYDYAVIGGGIIGVSTAWQLKHRLPNSQIIILEKEDDLACHQTGHNSGVIHSGVYYHPDSMKALFCRAGVEATIKFSRSNNIPYDQCGKLIVATNKIEQDRLHDLYARSQINQIDCEMLSGAALKDLEPNIMGTGAMFAKTTGIADYRAICHAMAAKFKKAGGKILLASPVTAIRETSDEIILRAGNQEIFAKYSIACAGLMADRVAGMLGVNPEFRIVPFRGEYYQLPSCKNNFIQHLIYPVPDPILPFLGVHLTRMIDGSITVGPNAVLALAREGYPKGSVNLRDIMEMAAFRGFWKLMKTHIKSGISEMTNSLIKFEYLKLCQKYCPELTLDDLRPHPAGIRAQAVALDGSLINDFLFIDTPRTILVCNAPSPAATAAIPIGKHIVDKIAERFES